MKSTQKKSTQKKSFVDHEEPKDSFSSVTMPKNRSRAKITETKEYSDPVVYFHFSGPTTPIVAECRNFTRTLTRYNGGCSVTLSFSYVPRGYMIALGGCTFLLYLMRRNSDGTLTQFKTLRLKPTWMFFCKPEDFSFEEPVSPGLFEAVEQIEYKMEGNCRTC